MEILDWKAFYDTLSVEVTDVAGQPVPAPTPGDLDRFEAEAGVRLPLSYREFVLAFGPGEFPCFLRIAAPVPPGADVGHFDLKEVMRGYGYGEDDLARSGLPPQERERVRHLVYFGLAHGEDWLGWDVRDPAGREYAIYRIDHRRDRVEFAGDSLRKVVGDLCEFYFAPDPDHDEATMGPRRAFERVTRPASGRRVPPSPTT